MTTRTADQLFVAALQALRSYQHGNAAPALAKEIADMMQHYRERTAPTRGCLVSNLGEGLHSGMRKAVDSDQSAALYRIVHTMPDDEWRAIIEWALDGLGPENFVVFRAEQSASKPLSATPSAEKVL